MKVEIFLDTNVFLYAASSDPADKKKRLCALELIRTEPFGLSMQVLQEFYHNARVKARLGISNEVLEKMLGLMGRRPLVLTDSDLFAEARKITERYQLQYWDAAMIAAAHRLKATCFYSEDLSAGQWVDRVQVVNPFADC